MHEQASDKSYQPPKNISIVVRWHSMSTNAVVPGSVVEYQPGQMWMHEQASDKKSPHTPRLHHY
jgi:hypothetical protein